MPILNYTTKIDSYKTILEIQKCLSSHGVSKIVTDNDTSGNPVAITFCIQFNGRLQGFALPCNFEGVKRAMNKSPKVPRSMCTDEQALRVGWRIIKDWVEAQMAIVEAGISDIAEVFIPYAITKTGDTVYQMLKADNQLLLSN